MIRRLTVNALVYQRSDIGPVKKLISTIRNFNIPPGKTRGIWPSLVPGEWGVWQCGSKDAFVKRMACWTRTSKTTTMKHFWELCNMKMSVFLYFTYRLTSRGFFSVGNTRFFKVVTPIEQRKKWIRSWIIERLDRKLADAIGFNTVEKCGVTLSRVIQPLTFDVLRVLCFLAYFTISVFGHTYWPCFEVKDEEDFPL